MNNTESTSIHKYGDKYALAAFGGYDGFFRREYDNLEDALAALIQLWEDK